MSDTDVLMQLVRPDLRGFAGYSSARREASGGTVLLNANESPWPTAGTGSPLNRYPDPQPEALRQRLADLYGARPDQLLIGRGSDEPIDLLVRALCRPTVDGVLISPPTFGMYAVCARLQNAPLIEVALKDAASGFALDSAAVVECAVQQRARLVFVCSPNNPTGCLVPLTEVEAIAMALSGQAVVVVDEAYAEYADSPSAAGLIDRLPNLAVLRTLSKAHGLAGARVGTLIARAELVGLLRSLMAPYPLPAPCVDAALAALSDEALQLSLERIALTLSERQRLHAELTGLSGVVEVFPSDANFLLVRFGNGAATYQQLLAEGIVLRDMGRHPALTHCLRISVGTPAENDRLLAVLARLEQPA